MFDLGKFYSDLKNPNVAFGVVDRYDKVEEIQKIYRAHNFTFPILARETAEESISKLYNRQKTVDYDMTYIIGPDKKILWANKGPFGDQIDAIMAELKKLD